MMFSFIGNKSTKSASRQIFWNSHLRPILLVTVMCVAILGFSRSNAHNAPTGWSYPPECCGGQDCAPVSDNRVRIVPGGFLLDNKHFIPNARVRFSQDDDYHACFHPNPDTLHCFFIPPQGA